MDFLDKVNSLITKGEQALATHSPNPPGVIGFPTLDDGLFSAWKTQSLAFLERQFSATSPYYIEFAEKVKHPFRSAVKTGNGILAAVLEEFESGSVGAQSSSRAPASVIRNICDRFHLIARQLRERYSNRETLDVQDEYDVQDLFHAILHLYFADIRPEEWTPSYAGKSARVDFLLKQERIVIELKKTRKNLGAKELGSELIEDIHRYQSHPDCDALLCFVYDPEGRVVNPRGLEADLGRNENEFLVEVYIRP